MINQAIDKIIKELDGLDLGSVYIDAQNNSGNYQQNIQDGIENGYSPELAKQYADNIGYIGFYIDIDFYGGSEFVEIEVDYSKILAKVHEIMDKHLPKGCVYDKTVSHGDLEIIGKNYPRAKTS